MGALRSSSNSRGREYRSSKDASNTNIKVSNSRCRSNSRGNGGGYGTNNRRRSSSSSNGKNRATTVYADISEQWFFDKEDILNTPSLIGNDFTQTPTSTSSSTAVATTPSPGKCFTFAEERRWREKGCNFIYNVARRLNLPQIVVATACVFFHRFYMRQSLCDFHAYDVAGACVFLSTKVEEQKHNPKSIAFACAMVGAKGNEKEATQRCDQWQRNLQKHEIVVLENCCFDMDIVHPYQYISPLISELNVSVQVGKSAWAHVNDCLRTVICLLYKPEIIAISALYLASHIHDEPLNPNMLNNIKVPLGQNASKVIEECVMDMLDFYQREVDVEVAQYRQQQQHNHHIQSKATSPDSSSNNNNNNSNNNNNNNNSGGTSSLISGTLHQQQNRI